MCSDLRNDSSYHFIGIGGIGMSALAHILLGRGQRVTGSDLRSSSVLDGLKVKGAEIFVGRHPDNLQEIPTVIYSTDIPEGNVEVKAAKEKGCSFLHRSELLAQLMQGTAPLLV